jgi:hypothetical protein
VALGVRRCILSVALVVAVASCGSSSKAAPITVSPACTAAMNASAQADDNPNITDAQDSASLSATVHSCQSRAEWLQAVTPYVSSGVNTCVVCGNAKPAVVLDGICTGEDASAPGCK